MSSEMKRGRSQVIWRYTPGATYRFNDSGAWCSTTEITLADTQPLDGALASAVNNLLKNWNAINPSQFPDPIKQASKFAVGEPHHVYYTLFPLVFVCRSCGRVHYYADLNKLSEVNSRLSCRSCKTADILRQVPYAYVCECGRRDSISMQGHDRNHFIVLEDKGSFRESYWRCKDCGISLSRNPREGLGYRRCDCAPKKGKRGILLEDNRVYYSHSVTLVEIAPAILRGWQDHPKYNDLLLGAVLDLPSYKPSHLQDLSSITTVGSVLSPALMKMVELLVTGGMDRAQAERMARESNAQSGGDAWSSYERDLQPLRSKLPPIDWRNHRPTVEYAFVRDEPSIGALSLRQLEEEARVAGDSANSSRLRDDAKIADDLGLIDLRIVQALPTVLAGVGYSRYSASPRNKGEDDSDKGADLRPYPEPNGRIPIFVARNTTEALLYRLDPWRLAAYLKINASIEPPKSSLVSEQELRVWLMANTPSLLDRGEAHLVLKSFELEAGVGVELPSALVFGVLHSISHVLKGTAHRFVGLDGDSLAEYLFPAHGAGLLYASKFVDFTLGGIDAAVRSNLRQWLGSARDFAGQCSFDPVCSKSGGACLACMYPKFGCAYFNRTVSRAFLFGGRVSGLEERIEGYWTKAVTEQRKVMVGGI